MPQGAFEKIQVQLLLTHLALQLGDLPATAERCRRA